MCLSALLYLHQPWINQDGSHKPIMFHDSLNSEIPWTSASLPWLPCRGTTAPPDESSQGNTILELASWNKKTLCISCGQTVLNRKKIAPISILLLVMSCSWTLTKMGYFNWNKISAFASQPWSMYKLFLQDGIIASQPDASDYTLLRGNENSLSAPGAHAV